MISINICLVKKYNLSSQRHLTYTYSESIRLIALTEYYIEKWLSRLAKDGAIVNIAQVREQARVLYFTIVAKKKIIYPPKLNAFIGWLAKIKKRNGIKYARYLGELASADFEVSTEFSSFAKQIIADGGYCPDQIYNCDETGFYVSIIAVAKGYLHCQVGETSHRSENGKGQILFTCNASGSHRMKPLLIYKYKKPHACKNLQEL